MIALLAGIDEASAATVTAAVDTASNYGAAWSGNGGSGLDSWVFRNNGGGGEFLANTTANTDLNYIWSLPDYKGWGTWANGGGVEEMAAFRGFGWNGSDWVHALESAGDQCEISMENGSSQSGGACGFVLRNGNSDSSEDDYNTNARFEFGFVGGDSNYSIWDNAGKRDSGVAWTHEGVDVVFELTAANTYTATVYWANGGSRAGGMDGTLSGSGSIDSISLYNRDTESANVYFNKLTILQNAPEYLDSDGTTSGFAGNTGTIEWNTTDDKWSRDSAGAVALSPWVDGENANVQVGASALTLDTDADRSVAVLNVSGDQNLTINSNTLTIGASGIDHDAAGRTALIASDIVLGAAQTWTVTNASSTVLDVDGNIDTGGNLLTLQVSPAASYNDFRFDGRISGAGGLSFTSGADVRFQGSNSFSGDVTIDPGGNDGSHLLYVDLYDNDALGSAAGGTSVDNYGALRLNDGVAIASEPLTLDSRGAWNAGALVSRNANNTWGGPISITDISTIYSQTAGYALTLSGGISNGAASYKSVRLEGNGDFIVTNSPIADVGAMFGVVKLGNGTLTMAVDNSFSGTMAVYDGTTVVDSVANGGVNSPLGAGPAVELGSSWGGDYHGVIRYAGTGSTDRQFSFVGGKDAGEENNGGAIEVVSGTLTISGNIAGGGDTVASGARRVMRKRGSGTVIYSYAGVCGYDGYAYIDEGTL